MAIPSTRFSLYASLFLSVSIFTACKKDSMEPDTPGFRLFTNKTEIVDPVIKAKFLKRFAAEFSPAPTVVLTEKINFIAADTVTFGASTTRYSVVKTNNQYLFYSPFRYHAAGEKDLVRDLVKYTSPRVPVSFVSGTYECVDKVVRVGYGDMKQIQLAHLQYRWTMEDRWMGIISKRGEQGAVFNELNEAVISKIGAFDTLAVRASRVSVSVQ